MNELKLDYLLLELKYIVDTFQKDWDYMIDEENMGEFVYDNVNLYLDSEQIVNIYGADVLLDEIDEDDLFEKYSTDELLTKMNDRDIIEYVADNMYLEDVVCFNN